MYSWFEKRINPFPKAEPAVPPSAFFPFVWQSSKGMRGWILFFTFLSAVVGVFEAILFAALGKVVDWLSDIEPALLWHEHGDTLLLLGAIIIGSVLLVGLETMIKGQTIAGNLPTRLRWNFHRLMLGQSISFFQDEFAGRVVTKVLQTSLALRSIYMIIVGVLVYVIIYFSTITISIGHFDLRLLWPVGLWLVSYLAVLRWIIPQLSRASKKMANSRSTMVGRITDAYTNIATVKLFSHAGREAAYARSAMSEYLQTICALMRKTTSFQIINQFLSMSLIVGACGTALWLWSKGEVGMGALAAIGAMSLRLNGMSQWIMWESTQLFEHVGTIYDGITTLANARSITDAPGAEPLKVSAGEIRFDRVSFSYGGKYPDPVIKDLSLHIRPGEKIGLVGNSGAGKSTLVSLLLRFHDVESGSISIDGQNIALVTQDSLRGQIGMVMQDTSLLHRSVRDNILYGRQDATEDDMLNAAWQAKADKFIERLADAKGRRGFDAHVGERGVKLSGGQRQRIAIARVMLKDAPILLLDEATSALDSEVETAIQENLYRLMEGKTVVAIAHRLSTIAAMDRLVVLRGGRIAEEGDHQSLLARGGVYAKLWAHQSGGFLGVDD